MAISPEKPDHGIIATEKNKLGRASKYQLPQRTKFLASQLVIIVRSSR
jgi:hypothetical protein